MPAGPTWDTTLADSLHTHGFLQEDMRLVVPFVSTTDNMADFFTKPLGSRDFFRMRDIIMNVPSRREPG